MLKATTIGVALGFVALLAQGCSSGGASIGSPGDGGSSDGSSGSESGSSSGSSSSGGDGGSSTCPMGYSCMLVPGSTVMGCILDGTTHPPNCSSQATCSTLRPGWTCTMVNGSGYCAKGC